MPAQAPEKLTSLGFELDMPAFGPLRDSSPILRDAEALRQRMKEDGYLYLPGALDRDEVLAARLDLCQQLEAEGNLDPSRPVMEAVAIEGLKLHFKPDLAAKCQPLKKVVYDGLMMEFFTRFLGGPVRHYDFTWLRAIAPGLGTPPHYDVVYMGRGTKNLYTAWTPLGDVDFDLGGLMILENSHLNERIKNTYGTKDVDTFCSNKPDAELYAAGTKWWNGWLSANPVSLRKMKDLGGRWLSAEFRAGDVLVFSMFTIHASLDNHSNRIRLSSDTRYQLASEPVDERWVGPNPPAHGKAGKRGRIC
jgi:hypothetical protein